MWAMMERRYDAYRTMVRPFFRDHFARLDRQIVLVDALAALDGGPAAVRDLQDALTAVLDCFRLGRGGWLDALFSARAPTASSSPRPRPISSITRRTTGSKHSSSASTAARWPAPARRRRGRCDRPRRGARHPRGAMRGEGGELPRSSAPRSPGEWSDGRHFDGNTEFALFPGDLPAEELKGGDFRSIRFRPPPLEKTDDGTAGLAAYSPRPGAAIPDRGPAAMSETIRKPAVFSVDDPRLARGTAGGCSFSTTNFGRSVSGRNSPELTQTARHLLGRAVLVGALRPRPDGTGPRGHEPGRRPIPRARPGSALSVLRWRRSQAWRCLP